LTQGLFSGAVSTQQEVGAKCNQYNHYVYIPVQTRGLQQSLQRKVNVMSIAEKRPLSV